MYAKPKQTNKQKQLEDSHEKDKECIIKKLNEYNCQIIMS